MIYILCGYQGSGKDMLLKSIMDSHKDLRRIVSYTTRPMRPGEENGVEYHFVSDGEYNRMVDNGTIFESRVFEVGNDIYRYGSAMLSTEELKSNNYITILDCRGVLDYIDIYGSEIIKVIEIYSSRLDRRDRVNMRDPMNFDISKFEERDNHDMSDFDWFRNLMVEELCLGNFCTYTNAASSKELACLGFKVFYDCIVKEEIPL